jgi:uncharacterized protein YjbJ (UPF0337 family)
MNKTTLRGKFRKTRGGVVAEWGRLTENDRLFFEGKVDQMIGMLQERYGYTRERAAALLEQYMRTHPKQAAESPFVSMTVPYALLPLFGFVMVGTLGWFMFSKFFAKEQPPVFAEKPSKAEEWTIDEFEAEDFEGALMGFEAALD